MAQDPKTIRFNDADRPDRLDHFDAALKKAAAHGGEVIRHLTDAYIRYVQKHGHSPAFPVELVPLDADVPKTTKRRKA